MTRSAGRFLSICPIVLGAWLLLPASGRTAEEPLEYNRDIRPILSDHCFACHGPDKNKRQADLRLDQREAALESKVLVAGQPDASELIARIDSSDPDTQMPPPAAHKPLTEQQRATLRQWVAEGAEYQPHWAYLPPRAHAIPSAMLSGFSQNSIDAFVLAELERHGIRPSQSADRRTLIRRLSLDLTGLPPTWAEVEQFVHDESPQAYEQLVDRLLDSPHFGERLAISWLDVVRYADTIGYHSDNPMQVYPYRDYVIRSFNENKPFDRFTREQLAGDLLPDSGLEGKTASAYNRLLQTTEEGGAQPKEYEAKYAADRVRNVGSAWLGITLGCCQCHDHKYDPFTMKDFYSMAAFFADIQEPAVGGRGEGTLLTTPEQQAELTRIDDAIQAARRHLAETEKTALANLPEWTQQHTPPTPAPPPPTDPDSPNPDSAALDSAGAQSSETAPVNAELPEPVRVALAVPAEQRTAEQVEAIKAYRLGADPQLTAAKDDLARWESKRAGFVAAITKCLTTVTGTPRTVRILPRGNWLDESGEIMMPATPGTLSQSSSTSTERLTRVDLANWITAPENPLTARVFVNRIWKLLFGYGLSRSLEDIGLQGELPSHPDLLDWLAVDFRDHGWDVKRLIKQIVMSGTYRQSSAPRPELSERDPNNRLLARQNRYRFEAEVVRDHALAVSGLLSQTIGGPSVKPYQPSGYWVALNFPTREWQNDQGEGLYRRGLYTHWQRSFLHPSLLAFDAPTREECVVDRPRSNLPQQALTLLNDPTYVEAARALAERIQQAGGADDASRIAWALETVVQRSPTQDEASALLEFHRRQCERFAQHRDQADQFLRIGSRPLPSDVDIAQLAAWTATARVLLNLHETITRF